jgi:hypothetical protein
MWIILLKIFDLGFISFIYVIFALALSKLIDKIFGKFDEKQEEKRTTYESIIILIGFVWLNALVLYLGRNFIPLIPSPFDKIHGFMHNKVKETETFFGFEFILIYFQSNMKDRMQYLYNKF